MTLPIASDTVPVRILRKDKEDLKQFGETVPGAIHKLLHPCEHPIENRQRLATAIVQHPVTHLTMPATIFHCNTCGEMLVLPGEPVEGENG